MRRELAVQCLEGIRQSAGVPANRPILRVPFELPFEERRSGMLGHFRLPGQLVVADGFQVQTAAVGVFVILRQGRNKLRLAFTLLRASLQFLCLRVSTWVVRYGA